MSDIPVGSPPVPPGRHAAASGWYPDPVDPARERYWDGWQWSRNTRPREGSGQVPYPVARPAAPGSTRTRPSPLPAPVPRTPGWARPRPCGPPCSRRTGVPVASWWWRALAALLDGLFTGVVGGLLSLPLLRDMVEAMSAWWVAALRSARAGATTPPSPPDLAGLLSTSDQLLIGLIALAVGMTYHAVFLRRRGATPGKMVAGLRVVPVDQGRASGLLAWPTVLVRALVWVLPGVYSVLFVITVADVLLPLWHPKRQALHDLAARTQVVRPGR